jgi:hypothetical protein
MSGFRTYPACTPVREALRSVTLTSGMTGEDRMDAFHTAMKLRDKFGDDAIRRALDLHCHARREGEMGIAGTMVAVAILLCRDRSAAASK